MTARATRGRVWLPVLAGVAVAAGLAWLLTGGAADADPAPAPGVLAAQGTPSAQPATATAAPRAAVAAGTGAAVPTPPPAGPPLSGAERELRRAQAQERLDRARQALDGYLQAARYPHESRPASEHPDQLQPFAPVAEEHPLRTPHGTALQGVKLLTTQERTFLTGSEASRVTLSLQDSSGRVLPLRVLRAVLHEVTPPGRTASTPEFVMPVGDAGQAGDTMAGDGIHTAWVQPALQGFGGYSGLLRLELHLDHAGQPGFIYFDFIVSPEQAARWLPGVRETLANGGLDFFVKAEVLLPGRYVVSARVDDASGRTFALALFNGELPRGVQELRLPVFGKLLRDVQPQFPLALRDIEAFLLKPDTYPDRVMLPRLAGVQHTSRSYAPGDFSDATWTSAERERYLAELGKDVTLAEQALKALGP
jgi:hypothetical protein